MNLTKRTSPNKNTGRSGWVPDMIVCHITEGTFGGAVDWLCNAASQSSTYFVVAKDGRIAQLVELTDTAWGNGTSAMTSDSRYYGHSTLAAVRDRKTNANYYTISIEHEGFLSDGQGTLTEAQLAATAELITYIRAEVKRLYGTDMPADRQHIVGHCEVVPKWKPNCPGPKYPYDEVIRRVNGGVVSTATSSGTAATPILRKGDKCDAVKLMQGLLNAVGASPALMVDGSFGPATEAAVKAFQSANGLTVDGICGPVTWAALLAHGYIKNDSSLTQSANDTVGIPLIGPPTATAAQAEAWARAEGATEIFVSLARLYWQYAADHGGINPVITYVQASLETGYGKCDGVVPEAFHNPCGMKTANGSSDTDANAHQCFASWDDGVKAHLDHLALYTGASGYPRTNTPDPRHFPFLLGTGKTVEAMSAGWCPGNKEYAGVIKKRITRLEATAVKEKTPIEITVDNLVSDIGATNPAYWLGVLTGNYQANLEYLIAAFDRYHEKLVGR